MSEISVNPVGEQVAHTEKEYALSTANVLDLSTLKAVFDWKIQDHVDLALRSGYQGVQLWPQRLKPLYQIRSGEITESEKKGILSAHQSARDSRPRTLQELQKALFLPETVASVADLNRLCPLVGDIPMVMFKENSQDMMTASPFTERGIQTDPETATAWGVTTPQAYWEEAQKRGFTNIIIDPHHLRRSDNNTGQPNPLCHWQESIPALLPHVNELHVSVGRTNFGDLGEQQLHAEAMDLISGGQHNTELIQMLRLVSDQGWTGRVVLEMRPSIYKDIMGKKFFMSGENLATIYQNVRETLYQVMDR